ncbi:MAG: peptide ABC transporter substrate-binding protein [Clostridiales bacterium]|nr:peptide ABC transporter substrate-binding protein [Candidatus Cacconaster stercorequi]
MTYPKKLTALLLALMMLLPVLGGCGQKEETPLTVTAVLSEVCAVPDPAMVTTDTEKTVVCHLYDNLMKLWPDSEGNVAAASAVAKRVETEDNDDGTVTYTFTLRSDAKWSDGKAVTAGDFVYAWRRLVDPKTKSPNASLLDMVSGYADARKGEGKKLAVTAPDDTTLQVVLAHPCPYFLHVVCTAAATMPVREDSTLTNGAYRVAEQTADELRLTAAADYYDASRIRAAELRLVLCDGAEAALTRCGEDDWDVAPGLAAGQDEGAQPAYYAETGVLLINRLAKKLTDPALHQAMSLVIDRHAAAQACGADCVAADGLIPVGICNTQGEDFRTASGALIDTVAEDYEKNCQTARELLAQAGFDAAALKALGKVTLRYEQSQQALAEELQTVWQQKLGLTVTLLPETAEALQSDLQKGEFTMALTAVRGDRNDAVGYLNTWRSGNSGNWANVHSAAYDTLLRMANVTTHAEARDAYLGDAERLLVEDGSVMPLYFTARYVRTNHGMQGLLGDGQGVYCFAAMHPAA